MTGIDEIDQRAERIQSGPHPTDCKGNSNRPGWEHTRRNVPLLWIANESPPKAGIVGKFRGKWQRHGVRLISKFLRLYFFFTSFR